MQSESRGDTKSQLHNGANRNDRRRKSRGTTNNAQGDENRVIQVVDNPQLENKNGTTDTILDKGGKRKRLYWIDWCRTQSVLNVVLGYMDGCTASNWF